MSASALQVARHDSATAWWEMVTRSPHHSLRGLVSRYQGYREDSIEPVRRREVPSGNVELILSFGPKIRVLDPADHTVAWGAASSFVASVGNAWAMTEYTGAQYGLQITMSPLAAGMFLGTPMDGFAGQVVELEQLLGREAPLLIERLAEAPDWASRFDLLDVVLPARLAGARMPAPAAAWAWQRLRETDGRIAIGALAGDLRCSHRYLCTQFRAHVGVSPKTYAKVLRCRRALRLLDHRDRVDPEDSIYPARPAQTIADIALDCGYSDQAHLNRDFRQLVGVTPTQWSAECTADSPAAQLRET